MGGVSVRRVPDEYIDYLLCEKFGWLPSEIDEQDDYLLTIFLEILGFENEEKERAYRRLEKK